MSRHKKEKRELFAISYCKLMYNTINVKILGQITKYKDPVASFQNPLFLSHFCFRLWMEFILSKSGRTSLNNLFWFLRKGEKKNILTNVSLGICICKTFLQLFLKLMVFCTMLRKKSITLNGAWVRTIYTEYS